MLTALNKAWRLLATGFSFLMFGLGGLILPWLAIPVLYLLPGGDLQRERRAKALVHYAFRAFVEMMRWLGVLTYSVTNRTELNRPGQLIFANHPSLIDVVFLIAFIKRADCVVKSSLLNNPFMRGPIKVAGYIANDSPEQVIQSAAQSLQRGNSLIVFPEGTRTTPGQPISMPRGAANIALRTNSDITPVILSLNPTSLTKELKWHQIPERRTHFSLMLRPNLNIQEFQDMPTQTRSARQLTRFLEQFFSKEITQT
ncbi:MAG: 1-acyl-sn-glycerol-3-phosphate acyltransferase [Gammaproteobacteria bacterium]|nr:MAG: 1-acyl-sn-glycerol-3-phosphate acyltransferase [Gammaproteobacteria bacterium]RLA12714.1 MAG: 1-acyl-sn-glycerol-3-phosphate acyltransferase [Gammaproteobacteria bacterium]RLA16672.1 MAG: 1-acyl-sn-glycerol-3-phosphate acyltransferase [Gammaproteobacteria bacterium]